MSVRKITLHQFYNEATQGSLANIGSGYRTVLVLPPGRKWVTLVDWTTLDVASVLRKEWDRKKTKPVEYRTTRILAAMKERLRYKFPPGDDGKPGKPTKTIKEAIQMVKGAA